MSFNNISSNTPYYNPYPGVPQYQAVGEAPTTTAMVHATTNSVDQDQNNPAPVAVAQAQRQPQPQASETAAMEIDAHQHTITTPAQNQNIPAPVTALQRQPEEQSTSSAEMMIDESSVEKKIAKPQNREPIVPLALHLVSFGNTPNAGDYGIVDRCKPIIAKLKSLLSDTLSQLRPLHYEIEQVRDSLSLAKNDPSLVNQVPDLEKKLAELENRQMGLLVASDTFLVNQGIGLTIDTIRCITWIYRNADQGVIAPFFTCTTNDEHHVMMYTVPQGYVFANHTLKVVVDKYLVEIPFEIQTQEESMKIVVVAKVVKSLEGEVTGVEVVLYHDNTL